MKRSDVSPEEFADLQREYCDLMAAGRGHVAALEATGLSASQAAEAWYCDPRHPNPVEADSVTLPALPSKDDESAFQLALFRRGEIVASLRAGLHSKYPGNQLSWGQIGFVCGVPESAVHTAFKATGIDSHGTRKGQGGRFLDRNPLLYLGNRKGIG